ncbi:hypothetical protein EDB92DRAFT_1562179 [Lactarius akahatsu]|uniref:Uncharacterized protein n=1 Tax=Lactarius akahatsu TaxID=416441 RepID=A0AAD4LBV5_9AGAM|nr:hypothetical protein EDB92DRAFT_800172 [Lactarius akahatsu]KAH8983652.1 hypothetical protein EDB92DRAFT_1562179 [Lactarius akahatsu]
MRDRDLESQPPPAPVCAFRRSSSSQSRVPSRRVSKTPLSPPSPASSPPPTSETGTTTRWVSYPPTPFPHDCCLLWTARARLRNGEDGVRSRTAPPSRHVQARPSASKATAPDTPAPDGGQGESAGGGQLGSKELVHVPRVAFENRPGAGSTGHSRTKTNAAREMVVVGITKTTKRRERQGPSPRYPCPSIRRWLQHSHTTQRMTASTGCDQWQYAQVDEGDMRCYFK